MPLQIQAFAQFFRYLRNFRQRLGSRETRTFKWAPNIKPTRNPVPPSHRATGFYLKISTDIAEITCSAREAALSQKGRIRCMEVVIAMLFAMLLGVPSLLLHECGHLAAARLCGVKVKRVGISWIGLFVQRESGPRWANLLISFSGPFVNLLLSAALWNTAPEFAQINLFVGVASLIPLPKSDGRRIITLLYTPETTWRNPHRIG